MNGRFQRVEMLAGAFLFVVSGVVFCLPFIIAPQQQALGLFWPSMSIGLVIMVSAVALVAMGWRR